MSLSEVSSSATANHQLAAHDVVLMHETDAHRGLAADEAAARLDRFGPNVLPAASRGGLLVRMAGQVRHPLIYVLIAVGVITAVLASTSTRSSFRSGAGQRRGGRLPGDRSGHQPGRHAIHPSTDPETFEEQGAVNLVFTGLLAMHDPPRAAAAATVRACHTAGIEVKMITGDHAARPRRSPSISACWTTTPQGRSS